MYRYIIISVADPIRMFLSLSSGSFYHQAKIVRKTLIPTVVWPFYDFLSLKNDVNVPSISINQINIEKYFLLPFWISLTKIAGPGSESGSGSVSVSQSYGSADPDSSQNVTDPQHRIKVVKRTPLGLQRPASSKNFRTKHYTGGQGVGLSQLFTF